MAASFQNLRAITTGVEPTSLLPGQLCFNLADKVLFVGDGSDFKTSFDGTQVAGATGGGWYSLPLDFSNLGKFFVSNPLYYGDSPADQQVLTWDETANHPVWSSGGSAAGPQVYATTNSAVDSAPGATVSEKISNAIVVSFPEEGDSAIVAGIFGDTYEGLYIYSGTEWLKSAAYASPLDADYTTKGLVQLADTVTTKTGTSDTSAVTPKSLQDKVTDDTATTDSNLVASATAVKAAFDKGAAAETLAQTGVDNAATAQSTADGAVTDAAAAQTAADDAAALAATGGITSATTLFVSPLGNDTSGERGTQRPFATVNAALSAAQNGDTIFLAPGSYTENVTLTKGVDLIGTYTDQSTLAGSIIKGNFVLDLTAPAATENPAIRNLHFRSVNSGSAFKVVNNSSSAGGITTVTDCMFTQQSAGNLSEFCFETTGTWTRSLYVRRPDFNGNIKHAAGAVTGDGGYVVVDTIEGTGSPTHYYDISTGTFEFRRPSNSLSPVLHTGGVVEFIELDNGISPSDVSLNSLFGVPGICYKSTALGGGGSNIVIFNGNNLLEGTVDIGENVIYGWNNLSINSENLSVDPNAIPVTLDPSYATGLNLSQGRPQIDILGTATTPANIIGNLVATDEGAFHAVKSSLVFVAAPTASTDAGNAGEVAIDASYLYVHNGTAWTRIALDTTPW